MKMNVVIDGQKYLVEVEDIHARPVVATIEGERFEVWPESETDETESKDAKAVPSISVPEPEQPFEVLTQTGEANGGLKEVAAPLPGVIVAILVEPGDNVSRGQELCTLEAMKMKNAIRANRDGEVASVQVSVGDQVGHGQVLMRFAD